MAAQDSAPIAVADGTVHAPQAFEPAAMTNAEADEGHAVSRLDIVRIVLVAICAIALWFIEAYFFLPDDSVWMAIPNVAKNLDPWLFFAVGDALPDWLREALPGGVVAWIDYWLIFPFSTWAAAGLVIGGWPIFKEAFHDLLERRMTMELSMTIALLAATYTGYFFATQIIIFFVLIAEIFEGMTIERGRRAIRELLELLPRQVRVRRGGEVREVAADLLQAGETVLVAPGGRVPVDGAVIGGHSFVDESRITGESMPVEKTAGASVYAGSINQSGVIEVRAERIGADTSYGKIIEAVETAERSRAPITRVADRLATYIVLFAASFAALNQYLYRDLSVTIAILVVAGACGVAAGTPLAILGGIGRAARLGAIIKGGVHLEVLGKVDTVVLDKTGTLTFGRPRVVSVAPAEGVSPSELVSLAATAEAHTEHPLGKAILEYANAAAWPVAEPGRFDYTPGRGVAAIIGDTRVLVGNDVWMRENGIEPAGLAGGDGAATSLFVAREGRLLGSLAVADTVRPEARRAIEGLAAKRIKTILLTGDNAAVAAAIARELGIAEVEANLLPEQKVERIKRLVAQRRTVAMVGDGINDAPALAAAHVGVAMGSGTDVARESADIVLIGNDLERFVDTVEVARRTRRIIWQNFAATILIDVVGVALAYKGLLSVVAAIQIHTGSEFVLILNAARLLPKWSPFGRRGKTGAGNEAPALTGMRPVGGNTA